MEYSKAEQSLLQLAHRVTDRGLVRDVRIAWIGAIALWIADASIAVGDPTASKSIGFAGVLAGFGGMTLGYVTLRTRALTLIQKLLASNVPPQFPYSGSAAINSPQE